MQNVPEKYHAALMKDLPLREICAETGLKKGTVNAYRWYLKQAGKDVPRAERTAMPEPVHAGLLNSLSVCQSCGSDAGFANIGTARGSKRMQCKECGKKVLLTTVVLDDIASFFDYQSWRELELDLAHGKTEISIKHLTSKV